MEIARKLWIFLLLIPRARGFTYRDSIAASPFYQASERLKKSLRLETIDRKTKAESQSDRRTL